MRVLTHRVNNLLKVRPDVYWSSPVCSCGGVQQDWCEETARVEASRMDWSSVPLSTLRPSWFSLPNEGNSYKRRRNLGSVRQTTWFAVELLHSSCRLRGLVSCQTWQAVSSHLGVQWPSNVTNSREVCCLNPLINLSPEISSRGGEI